MSNFKPAKSPLATIDNTISAYQDADTEVMTQSKDSLASSQTGTVDLPLSMKISKSVDMNDSTKLMKASSSSMLNTLELPPPIEVQKPNKSQEINTKTTGDQQPPVLIFKKPELNRLPSKSMSNGSATSLNGPGDLSPLVRNIKSMFDQSGSSSSLAGPLEVNFKRESADSLVVKEKTYNVQLVKASVDDFQSVDNLLGQLDQLKRLEMKTQSNEFLTSVTFETPEQKRKNLEARKKEARARLEEAQVSKAQVRVYIESDQTYRTIQVTSLQTVPDVTKVIIEKANLVADAQWTLFEYLVELDIVRPLRQFEYVTEVMKLWQQETKNALMIKPYAHKNTLTAVISQKTTHKGTMFVQFDTVWKKGTCVLSSEGLFYVDRSAEVKLCDIQECDVFYSLKPRKKAPYKFCFSVKQSDSDVRFFSIDTQEKLDEWVLTILTLKTQNIVKPPPNSHRISRFALPGLASPVVPKSTKPWVGSE